MSLLAGIQVTVTSPHDPRGEKGGRTRRYNELLSPSTYLGSAVTSSGRKCFQERIFRAAGGVARMVDWQSLGS
jgi:hypothetical protein